MLPPEADRLWTLNAVRVPVGVGGHCSKLQDLELAVAAPDPRLTEEDRAGGVELDHGRRQGKKGREDKEPQGRADNVHGAFQRQRGAAETGRGKPDERQALGGMDRRLRPDHLEQAGDDVDLNVERVEVTDKGERAGIRIV